MATKRKDTIYKRLSSLPPQDVMPAIETGTDTETDDVRGLKASLFYTMLPRLVRTRIRRIHSIRRTVSGYGSPCSFDTGVKTSSGWSGREIDDELRSPPPQYRSRVSSSEPASDIEVPDLYDSSGNATAYDGSNKAQFSARDRVSGIRWKFANQGLSLLHLAAQESSSVSTEPSASSPSLARQLYIHGVTYLIRGLPKDLSAEEKISVWSSVPESIHDLSAGCGESRELLVLQTSGAPAICPNSPEPAPSPSVLHRLLASLIVQLFLAANFLLPYIKILLATIYRYERQHRISERVFAFSVNTMDWSVKKSVEFSGSVGQINEGKVGQAINELAVWWIRGIMGGIHQGVGEGLVIMGIDEAEPRKGKGRTRR